MVSSKTGFFQSKFKYFFFFGGFLLVCYLSIQGLQLIDRLIEAGFSYTKSLPEPKVAEKSGESSRIYDREGNFLYEIHGDIRRRNVSLKEVPELVKNAFIAAEDHEFYKHSGISIKNILVSLQRNLQEEEVERGASTIPMQLVRNLTSADDETLSRKINEMIMAILINVHYTKDQILERYLNEVPVGGNLVGIAAASETYFQKEASQLSLMEGATIAALINAPSRLSPYNEGQNLRQRTEMILDQMVELNYISRSAAEEAKREELHFASNVETIKYPYWVMYIKSLLEEKYGSEKVEYGGWKIYTTINPKLQELAENKIREKISDNSQKWNANDAGLVTIDPKTGQILTMVGGKDYWDSQVNIITSKRQPGSSFKPFIYLTAFEQGYSDQTVVLDQVQDFGGGYKPEDYGGGASGKWWPIRQALIQSLNIPAVSTLEKIGVESTIVRIQQLGFSSLDTQQFYGLSFALGSAEVMPLDMAVGASVLANGGNQVKPIAILKIEKPDGNVILNNESIKTETPIADQNAVALVNDILSDYNTKKSFYNYTWFQNYSLSDRPAAAKTGTSSGPRDCWLIGYTPNLVTVIWTGNNDGSLMKSDADGINVAAPIWDSFMEEAVKSYSIENFSKPVKVVLDNYHRSIKHE